MVDCINVSDSRGIPETIYYSYSKDNGYYDILQASQDDLVKNGFLGSFSHVIFDTHVFSDSEYYKIVEIISPNFKRF